MPANSRVFLKPFIGGLNTEGSDTDDMVLNTSDELNCTILPEQMRGRRYGFNIERDGKWVDTDITYQTTGSIYYWKNVAKTDLDILVCRIGSKLYFFDAAIKPITDSDPIGSVDLKEYIIDDNNFYKEKFGFAVGDGKLTVVNRWMQPVRIIYNINSDELATEERFVVDSFTLSIRDTEGVTDSWGIKSAQKLIEEGNEEPTKALTDPSWTITDSGISKIYIPYCESDGECFLKRRRRGPSPKDVTIGPLTKTSVGTETHVFWDDKDIGVYQTGNSIYGGSKEHYYNLLNQGWTEGDLDKFSQAMSTAGITAIWPDNTMAVSVGRDNTGAYNTGDVVYTYLGNTQQPRGHFILDYFTMNRSEVSGIWDFKNAATAEYSYQNTWVHSRSLRGVMISNHSTTVENSKGKVARILLRWTKLYRKSAKKASDLHWRGNIEIKVYGLSGETWNLITTRQASSTDGASSSDPLSVNLEFDPNYQQEWDKFRVDVRYYNGNGTSDYPQPLGVTVKIAVFSNDADTGDYFNTQGDSSRITDVAYMSGKYFYLCKDSVLFSQTVGEDGSGFDLCYQEADPTSTEVSDVVTTDGGYVKFNTMGRGVALKTFNRGVLVFGRDVVYGLISPLESRFTATDYDILELSRAGLISAESVVSTTQQVYYWSPTGIYTIGVNPETGSTIFAQSISINTIQTFYNNLPQFSKEHCKGVYDYTTNRIYWYYPTNVDKLNDLDGCLVYDLTYNCFMPQNISEKSVSYLFDIAEVSQSYEIEPTYYLRAGGNRVVADTYKVLVSDETTTDYHRWTSVQHLIARYVSGRFQFSIGDFNDREFRDWDANEYSSYLVSRPITLGDTYFNKQAPVMQTLFKRTEEYPTTELIYEDVKYNIKDSVSSYCLKSNGEYPIDPHYGVLSKPSYATTWITNNDGVFRNCSLKLDVSDFIGTDIYILTAYIKCNHNLLTYKTLSHFTISSKYIDMELECPEDYIDHNNIGTYEIGIQLVDSNKSYGGSKNRIRFTGTFVQKRTNYRQKQFVELAEKTFEGTLYGTLNFLHSSSFPQITTSLGFLKSATITWVPEYANAEDGVYWNDSINLYGADTNRRYMSGNQGAFYPINTAAVVNINEQTVNSYYDTYSWNIDMDSAFNLSGDRLSLYHADLIGLSARYKLVLLVPQYLDKNPEVRRVNGFTTPSGAIIRMRWGWSVNPLSNRWDMMQNGYRPQKDFLHDDYVESRMHIRGRGKAFQVEIRNDENKDFRLTGLNIITRSPQ